MVELDGDAKDVAEEGDHAVWRYRWRLGREWIVARAAVPTVDNLEVPNVDIAVGRSVRLNVQERIIAGIAGACVEMVGYHLLVDDVDLAIGIDVAL